MKILIVGAHGQTGIQLVRKWAASNQSVFGLIRDKNQSADIENAGATPILGDLEGEIESFVEGMDTVAFCAGSGGHTGADKTILIDMLSAWNLIEAAEREKVSRFLMLSAMNVETPEQGGAPAHYYAAKRVADKRLQMSKLNFTIIRPGGLTNEPPTGKIQIGLSPSSIGGRRITRADVAEVMAQSLYRESTFRKTFDILNGDTSINQALDTLS